MFAARTSPITACHISQLSRVTGLTVCAPWVSPLFARTRGRAQVRSQLVTFGDGRGSPVEYRLHALSFNAICTSTGANVCCFHKPDHSFSHLETVAGLWFDRLRALSFNAIFTITGANVCCSHKPDPGLAHLATVARQFINAQT